MKNWPMYQRMNMGSVRPGFLLLPLIAILNLVIYDTSDYMKVTASFAICYSSLSILWGMGWLRKQLNQIIVVVTIFTFLFFNVSSLSGLKLKLNNVLFVRIVMGFGAMEVYNIYSKSSASSFTPSELSIVVTASFTSLSMSLSCVLDNYIGLEYQFCSIEKSTLVLNSIFLGCLFIVTNIYLIRRYIGREFHFFIYSTLMYGIVGTYLILVKTSSSEPIYWLVSYLTQTERRKNLVLIWSAILVPTLVFTYLFGRKTRRKASSVIRKVYHVASVVVFITGMKVDISFLKFTSASLLVLLILLEAIRVSNIPPLGPMIEECFKSFRDEKDSGPLTLSHIYLLVGMSLPLWIHPSEETSLAPSSGIISIGFGDTAASVIGNLIGRHKWKRSKKTIEGSIGAIVAMVLSSIWLMNLYSESPYSELYILISDMQIMIPIIIISILVAVIEAKTSQIDNLILPLYHYMFVSIFKLVWNQRL